MARWIVRKDLGDRITKEEETDSEGTIEKENKEIKGEEKERNVSRIASRNEINKLIRCTLRCDVLVNTFNQPNDRILSSGSKY